MRGNRFIAFSLAVVTVCSLFTCSFNSYAASTPDEIKLSGATKNTAKELSSGVRYTQLTANSGTKYGGSSGIEFNIVEADMSATNLYLDTVYGGETCLSYKAGTEIVKNFDTANPSLKPIAAINADGWHMSTNKAIEYSNNKKLLSGTGSLSMPVGFTMSNGEIYASDRMPQETYKYGDKATDFIPYEDQISFGITSDFVPVISNPNALVTITNKTKNTTAQADGINRLPTNNALVMYTDKGPKNNYSNDDAFDVKIKITSTNDYIIKHGTDITGTVESIHAPGTANPTMSANYIILTARGSQYNSISGYKKGDTINIKVSVFDQYGKYTSEWQKVTDAVCGHIAFAADGKTYTPGVASNYPATIIGITNSGNVLMLTSGATQDGSRKGLNQAVYAELAKELDLKDAFLLDGGGSSTMVIPSGSSYPIVNHCSDGSERSLPDMLILSTGPARLAQGKIPAIPKKTDSAVSIDFSNPANHIYVGEPCDTVITYEKNALKLTVPSGYDPYITLDYTKSSPRVSVTKNKFITIEYMLPKTNQSASPKSMFYAMCGSVHTADAAIRVTSDKLVRDGEFHKITIDMSAEKSWTGNLNKIRFDYFTSAKPGDVMYIKSVSLSTKAPVKETETPSATATVTPSADNNVTEAPVSTPGATATVPGVTETVPVSTPENSADVPTATNPVSDGNEDSSDDENDKDNGEKDSDKGLTVGAFIGIVAGVAGVLIAAIAVVMIVIKKKQLPKD